MTDVASSPTRKDAARNRARLLQAADELFSTEGLDVTLKDVARRAEVGVGTVYRHFPTKDDLVSALFTQQLDREIERARAGADKSDAWQALVDYLDGTMRVQAKNSGLRALMCVAGSTNPTVRDCKTLINPLVQRMVDKAHEQGTLRPDCDATDIAYIQVALVGIIDASPAGSSDLWERHLALLLAGMRASP